MTKLLLIDDDRELAELLAEFLSLEDFDVDMVHDGKAGLAAIRGNQYDMVLLDVMMPKLNGFEVLKKLRVDNNIPVLMLTAKGDEIDRVLGLEMGADDYLPKPFSERELLARIRAVLRRIEPPTTKKTELLTHLDIEINSRTQEAWCQTILLDLTSTELMLLEALISSPGTILTKADLSEQVLGKKLTPFDRSIDMHLSNLRKKLPERKDEKMRIRTLRGRGYMWLDT
ncbi:response regulator [Moritella yayanosii]|uniref:DNA-binding response regulator in two-component regulatory system with CpxA n=1 Tax=Moritella yayanosii TaxID=69539 RepID=A0A330LT99_9GAMM|nr:response regulator [Moritella yayanosii]SQD79642.1 DNA-binding response regulator in two-component regulatory system with CpxA [Moritella yayanosii]